ncbi:hypothetical protein DL764_000879 [Monosporascus ibericus]|uniref:Proteophosphoglycan 5 n=1 Tax=Monosporascus ibericus TaxID=155417 RepID=A0A4Q4TTH9_9PEZI|nr:hypothetical protein DL764_000879 [Monosporascus ibericus]
MTQSTQPKNTPSRRRQGRNNNNTNTTTTTTTTNNNSSNHKTPQKMYASENDIPSYKKSSPYASPCTPRRPAASGGDLSAFLQTGSANLKQRNKSNRNRNKHGGGGATSPGHEKQNRSSPPILSQQDSTPAIFAGSTFHASPAPSALPMPSFFARSHSDSPTMKSTIGPGQEPSPPSTDSEDAPSPPPVPRNEESPLEFFFRADRAEKARIHRANSVNAVTALPPGPFSPRHDSLQQQNTVPRVATGSQAGRRPDIPQRNTAPGISTNELDGTPGQPLGPAFSTPYQQRIRAARSGPNTAQITPTLSQNHDLDPSDALKRYLFHGQLGSSPQLASSKQQKAPRPQQSPRQQPPRKSPQQLVSQPPSPPEQRMPEQPSLPRGVFPASVLGDYSSTIRSKAPMEAGCTSPQRPDNIITMEDSLRRMLKLSPSN